MEPLERICGTCDLFADCSMKDTVTGCAGWRRIASSGTQRSEVPCEAPGSAAMLSQLEMNDLARELVEVANGQTIQCGFVPWEPLALMLSKYQISKR